VIGEGFVGSQLILAALNFGAMIVLQAISSFMSNWMASFTAENTTRRLRDYLFDHIQRLSYAYHAEANTGDLLERATSDVDTLRRFFADQAVGIGRIVFIFVINLAAIYSLSPRLALISIIIVPIILVVSMIFFKRLSKAYESYQEQEAVLTTNLQENLSGVRVVKAFARQEYEINKFELNNREKFNRGKKLNLMHSFFWPISDLISAAQQIFSSYTAAMMVLDGALTIGNFVTFNSLIGWLIWPIRNLGRLIVDTSRAFVSFGRVSEILRAPEEDLLSSPMNPLKGSLGKWSSKMLTLNMKRTIRYSKMSPSNAKQDRWSHCLVPPGLQDLSGQPASTLLRCHQWCHHVGWRKSERVFAVLSALTNWHCGAGTLPFLRFHPR
jgi:ATP-binding cassette subfamily B protein